MASVTITASVLMASVIYAWQVLLMANVLWKMYLCQSYYGK